MQWILCRQTAHDSVRYVTSDYPDEAQFKTYLSFIDFVGIYRLTDFAGFLKAINEFQILLIYPELRIWEEYKEEAPKEPTFNELLELNDSSKKKESKVDRLKKYLFSKSKIKTEGGLSNASDLSPRTSTGTSRTWKRGARIKTTQSWNTKR